MSKVCPITLFPRLNQFPQSVNTQFLHEHQQMDEIYLNRLADWFYLMLHLTLNIIIQTQTVPLTEICHSPCPTSPPPTQHLYLSLQFSVYYSSLQHLLSVVPENWQESD